MIHIIKSVIQDIHTIVDLRNRKVLIEALFYRYSLVKEIESKNQPKWETIFDFDYS
jgi:hypothetical protein